MLSAAGIWLICIATLSNAYSDAPELCVVSSPLVTPYFTPLLDTPRKARGCSALSSADPNAPFFERLDPSNRSAAAAAVPLEPRDVHVISLHAVGKPTYAPQSVKLSVVAARAGRGGRGGSGNDTTAGGSDVLDRLVVVLHADRPVKWILRVDLEEAGDGGDVYLSTQITVLLSEGSLVEGNVNMNVTHHKWANKKALHRYVKKAFKGIASYSEVKGANHLELTVGSPSKGFVQCDMTAQEDSSVVTASLMVQLKTEGCFHEDYIGDNPMDVYVVELEGGGKGRNRRVGPNALLPVMVQLLGEGTRPVPRNVTVVLKSHQPIRWQFWARRIHGNIVVVSDSEDQVENSSEDGYEQLDVRSKTLPDNMVELLLSVTSEYGPPILYAKTRHASTLRLVVGSKNKSGVRSGGEQSLAHVVSEVNRADPPAAAGGSRGGKEEMQQQPNFPGAVYVSSFATQEMDPVSRLKAAMTINCGKTIINISFPSALVRSLGSPHLSLRDPTCSATHNSSHATLSSHISSCGSTSDSDGRFTLFSNNVNVKFAPAMSDDEDDVEGSGAAGAGAALAEDGKIPVVCKYRPHFPGDKFPIPDDGNPDDETDSRHASLYHMEVYRDKQHKARVDFKAREVAEVELDEVLYVKAFLDGVVPVQVVTEECWISNSSDHRVAAHATLIRNTCPADLSTKIFMDANGGLPHGVFNFQVNKEYESLTLIYLHCRLGLCTVDKERSRGNLKMCVDPGQYCSGHTLRPYLDRAGVSTAQQFAFRGPLRPVVKRRPPPATPQGKQQHGPPDVVSVTAANSAGDAGGSAGGERIVHMGVSTEVAICIAIASFVIGVGLTGTLWCIHIRTDPFRQRNKQGGPLGVQVAGGNGAVPGAAAAAAANASPHSGGCTSANPQVAIAT